MGREELTDQRIKHLEMVQAVITRLGNDSFLVKGWAVTVSGVFYGFAVSSKLATLALVSMLPVLFFWSLDVYYLRAERLFRVLYERARLDAPGYVLFGMDATSDAFVKTLNEGAEQQIGSYPRTAWRPTLRYLYVGLIVAGIAVALVVSSIKAPGSPPQGKPHSVSEATLRP